MVQSLDVAPTGPDHLTVAAQHDRERAAAAAAAAAEL